MSRNGQKYLPREIAEIEISEPRNQFHLAFLHQVVPVKSSSSPSSSSFSLITIDLLSPSTPSSQWYALSQAHLSSPVHVILYYINFSCSPPKTISPTTTHTHPHLRTITAKITFLVPCRHTSLSAIVILIRVAAAKHRHFCRLDKPASASSLKTTTTTHSAVHQSALPPIRQRQQPPSLISARHRGG